MWYQSFEKLDSWRDEFLAQAGPRDPDSFPFIVLGNKVDKESERRVQKQKAQQWCQVKNPQQVRTRLRLPVRAFGTDGVNMVLQPIQHFETSAKEATSVEEAFITVAKTALQKGQEEDMYVGHWGTALETQSNRIQYGCSYVPETIDLSGAAIKNESKSCC